LGVSEERCVRDLRVKGYIKILFERKFNEWWNGIWM
jgi:hypothetical protein